MHTAACPSMTLVDIKAFYTQETILRNLGEKKKTHGTNAEPLSPPTSPSPSSPLLAHCGFEDEADYENEDGMQTEQDADFDGLFNIASFGRLAHLKRPGGHIVNALIAENVRWVMPLARGDEEMESVRGKV
jgi:hypothetical protein